MVGTCAVKKIMRRRDELLHLAIILSLLRVNPNSYFGLDFYNENDLLRDVRIGDTFAYLPRHFHGQTNHIPDLHRLKNIDYLLENQQSLFSELSLLGRYDRHNYNQEVPTYLLSADNTVPQTGSPALPVQEEPAAAGNAADVQTAEPEVDVGSLDLSFTVPGTSGGEDTWDMSQEDMDVIEVLLKQDIDLGVTRDVFEPILKAIGAPTHDTSASSELDENQIKIESDLKLENVSGDPTTNLTSILDSYFSDGLTVPSNDSVDEHFWSRQTSYSVDNETGEQIQLGDTFPPGPRSSQFSLSNSSGFGSSQDEDSSDSILLVAHRRPVLSTQRSQGGKSDKRGAEVAVVPELQVNYTALERDLVASRNIRLEQPLGSPQSDDVFLDDYDEDLNLFDGDNVDEKPLNNSKEDSINRVPSLDNDLFNSLIITEADAILDIKVEEDFKPIKFENDFELEEDKGLLDTGGQAAANQKRDSVAEELEAMIQAQLHPHAASTHHGRFLQGRVPFLRTVSMEQRWQDIASTMLTNQSVASSSHQLLAPPPPPPSDYAGEYMLHHHHHHPSLHHPIHHPMVGHQYSTGFLAHPHHSYMTGLDGRTNSVLIHNTTLPPPLPDASNVTNMTYHHHHHPMPMTSESIGDSGNLVATSLGTLSNSIDTLNCTDTHSNLLSGYPSLVAEHANITSMYGPTVNQTLLHSGGEIGNQNDGFLSSILNDDDLHLMDLAMNESNMPLYTMRMMDSSSSTNVTTAAPTIVTATNGGTVSAAAGNEDAMDTSSDSAVSSMGSVSERVPSLSDGEWLEGASEAPSDPSDPYHDYNASTKYGSLHRNGLYANYSYHHRTGDRRDSLAVVPQKKYQLFGKRFSSDQGGDTVPFQTTGGNVSLGLQSTGAPGVVPVIPSASAAPIKPYPDYLYDSSNLQGSDRGAIGGGLTYHNVTSSMTSGGSGLSLDGLSNSKYPCNLDYQRSNDRISLSGVQSGLSPMVGLNHNHTYHQMEPEAQSSRMHNEKPYSRRPGRSGSISSDISGTSESFSRDERRAAAMKIPMTTDEIINLPMDEFNERLSKFDLTESQLALIRDIRRRGKNKVAAQNCRKRKLDQIQTLADDVCSMHQERDSLISNHASMREERQRLKEKYAQLYHLVFQSLNEQEGGRYSQQHYALQQNSEGNMQLVPRSQLQLPSQIQINNQLQNNNPSTSAQLGMAGVVPATPGHLPVTPLASHYQMHPLSMQHNQMNVGRNHSFYDVSGAVGGFDRGMVAEGVKVEAPQRGGGMEQERNNA